MQYLGNVNFQNSDLKQVIIKQIYINLIVWHDFSKIRELFKPHTVLKSYFKLTYLVLLCSECRLFNLMTIQTELCNIQESHSSLQTKQNDQFSIFIKIIILTIKFNQDLSVANDGPRERCLMAFCGKSLFVPSLRSVSSSETSSSSASCSSSTFFKGCVDSDNNFS